MKLIPVSLFGKNGHFFLQTFQGYHLLFLHSLQLVVSFNFCHWINSSCSPIILTSLSTDVFFYDSDMEWSTYDDQWVFIYPHILYVHLLLSTHTPWPQFSWSSLIYFYVCNIALKTIIMSKLKCTPTVLQ